MSITSRFAPSPTGYLHLGHGFSAWKARQRADILLLRLEDIDATRCRPEFYGAIEEDLRWLGLAWDGEIRVQSAHFSDYAAALAALQGRALLYPCFCSRTDIARASAAPHAPDPVYPGTCRHLSKAERDDRIAAGAPYALRLNSAAASAEAGALKFFEEASGWVEARPEQLGDVVLARREMPVSYHLCVVHDDALQNITHVVRGEDLATATHIHVLLQKLLGLPTPIYAHHRLLLGPDGKRLAKRDGGMTLRALRAAGTTAASILQNFEAA
jgi:glutamyl-Q tRNA(Asp) synthetase